MMLNKIVAVITAALLVLGIYIIIQSFDVKDSETENILYVGGSEEGSYSSIQDAINASLDGDTVFVYHGIYNETIFINKSINLFGENSSTTIINSNNNYNVIAILDYWINITGFTIQNGPSYGILISSIGYCNIYQNIIRNNRIGIYIDGSVNSSIFNNIILNNYEIGIYIDKLSPGPPFGPVDLLKSENNTIYFNSFINNTQHANDESNNFWSYNNKGNYWDDYNGTDNNSDGLGDQPYNISGGNNVDGSPLMTIYETSIDEYEFQVDEDVLYRTLIIALAAAIIFVLPVGYIWYRKHHKK